MASTGDPGDNAGAESFFASFEMSCSAASGFATREQADCGLVVHRVLLQPPPQALQPQASSTQSTTNNNTNRRPSQPNPEVSTKTDFPCGAACPMG